MPTYEYTYENELGQACTFLMKASSRELADTLTQEECPDAIDCNLEVIVLEESVQYLHKVGIVFGEFSFTRYVVAGTYFEVVSLLLGEFIKVNNQKHFIRESWIKTSETLCRQDALILANN